MLERTHKKLREAQFFLGLLNAEDSKVLGRQSEIVDFYLSAFLSAARSVTFAMSKDHGAGTENWTTDWIGRLPGQDGNLMDFFVHQRNKIQKQGAADIEATLTTMSHVEFMQQISLQGGNYLTTGMPGVPPPTFSRTGARFAASPHASIGALCQNYLDLLSRLVSDFERENPGT
jgi:hypothetical protein